MENADKIDDKQREEIEYETGLQTIEILKKREQMFWIESFNKCTQVNFEEIYREYLMDDRSGGYRKSRARFDDETEEEWYPEICKYIFKNFKANCSYLKGFDKDPFGEKDKVGTVIKEMVKIVDRKSANDILKTHFTKTDSYLKDSVVDDTVILL